MRDDELIVDVVAGHSTGASVGTAWQSVAAAVVAVTALSVVVVWAYRLGVRDANDVPVIKALVEDMRLTPDDPGGLQVAHQERRVYDLVAGAAPAAEPVAALAPPPEPLAEDDVPMGALTALIEPAAPPASTAPTPEPAQVAPAAPAPAAARTSLDDLVAEALGAVPPPLDDGLASPRPRLRPILAAATVPQRPAPPPQPAIQLGAYQTRDVALQMWRSLAARNGDLLAGRDPVVSELVGTSRTLYGLRAVPFATTAEAQGLCAALRSRDEDCLVTEMR